MSNPPTPCSTEARRARALLSLAGLSVGDALGEQFFGPPPEVLERIAQRTLPPAPWPYTDDTQMALSVVEVLIEFDGIDADVLAERFTARYDPMRGYGSGAHGLIRAFGMGVPWQEAAPAMFFGTGSYGNGAAMRIAPLGAYFADDVDAVVEHARRASEVTHAHPEGIAGGIAVAVAAALAWHQGERGQVDPQALFDAVLTRTPAGETREGIAAAARLPADMHPHEVAGMLGSGQAVSAQDTVPFTIWSAAHHLDDYEGAFWNTVLGLGDRDTTCAMVGGIVALSARQIPDAWIAAREPLSEEFELPKLT